IGARDLLPVGSADEPCGSELASLRVVLGIVWIGYLLWCDILNIHPCDRLCCGSRG
ncbi:hypothetical protein BJV82DRAFT_597882, partial [Fennellomyces sp. T-0311]